MNKVPPIIDVAGILISSDIITEMFCCDYEKCKGICCVEGDAGAPVTMDEIAAIEEVLDDVWPDLSASAQSVIDLQGVAYADKDGDLVTSIVRGKDCVFTCYEGDNCLCALERAYRNRNHHHPSPFATPHSNLQVGEPHHPTFIKPISCSLYPIREKNFGNGLIGLNYHRWDVCRDAVIKGKELQLPVYKFLKEPLIRRFGEVWYQELCDVAEQLALLQ